MPDEYPDQLSRLLLQQQGLLAPGNIDLANRPRVPNADRTSTVLSASYNIDGEEVLLPRVSDDGRILSHEEAIQQYLNTRRHLGKFATPAASTRYAEQLHEDQAKLLQPVDRQGVPGNPGRISSLEPARPSNLPAILRYIKEIAQAQSEVPGIPNQIIGGALKMLTADKAKTIEDWEAGFPPVRGAGWTTHLTPGGEDILTSLPFSPTAGVSKVATAMLAAKELVPGLASLAGKPAIGAIFIPAGKFLSQQAEASRRLGMTDLEIWQKLNVTDAYPGTGWVKEIPAGTHKPLPSSTYSGTGTLSSLEDRPQLYKERPSAADIPVHVSPYSGTGSTGRTWPTHIEVNYESIPGLRGSTEHELQHWIGREEDWSHGASSHSWQNAAQNNWGDAAVMTPLAKMQAGWNGLKNPTPAEAAFTRLLNQQFGMASRGNMASRKWLGAMIYTHQPGEAQARGAAERVFMPPTQLSTTLPGNPLKMPNAGYLEPALAGQRLEIPQAALVDVPAVPQFGRGIAEDPPIHPPAAPLFVDKEGGFYGQLAHGLDAHGNYLNKLGVDNTPEEAFKRGLFYVDSGGDRHLIITGKEQASREEAEAVAQKYADKTRRPVDMQYDADRFTIQPTESGGKSQ